MTYQVLNGDSLKEHFLATKLNGTVIINRECLIVGNLAGNTLTEFWEVRAKFIEDSYNDDREGYFAKVVSEFEKIIAAPNNSEFNLWFGYDLFCQANMWFLLSLIQNSHITKKVFIVYPTYLKRDEIWNDFGYATTNDLIFCFETKIEFSEADLILGKNLWTAFKNNDLPKLEELSENKSPCFPYLKEVCQAHIERFNFKDGKGRPEIVIEAILKNVSTDFSKVFMEFSQREGVYGFGDFQVKQIYDNVILNQFL